jgi:hypothetical protein
MKTLLLPIALLFLGCGLSNDTDTKNEEPVIQTPFLKSYSLKTTQPNAITAKVIISSSTSSDDGYIMTGSISIDQNNTNNRGEDGLILKTDNNGNLIKSIYVMYYNSNINPTYAVNENFYDVAKSADIYLTITQISPTGSYSTKSTFLAFFDKDLNIKTAGLYKTSFGGVYAKHVKAFNDGSFLLIGDADVTQDSYGNIIKIGTVTKIDANGNVIWSKSYNSPEYYVNYGYGASSGDNWYYSNAVITKDAIYISGYFINSFAQSSILLIKLDLNGNFIWAKEYNRKYNDNYYPSIGFDIINVNNNLIIPFKDNDNQYTIESYGSLKVDYNGNVIDNKIYYHSTYLDEFALDKDTANNIYIGYGSSFLKTDASLNPLKTYSIYGGIKKGVKIQNNTPVFLTFNQTGNYAQYAKTLSQKW